MPSLNEVVAVPVSLSTYRAVLTRYPDRPNSLIEDLILDFLERTADELPRLTGPRGSGVMWESLFLPEKTRLRTMHHKEYKYAEVKGDSLACEGKKFPSVSQVTNHMRGGTQNNAWRVLEILLPNEQKWVSAESLR